MWRAPHCYPDNSCPDDGYPDNGYPDDGKYRSRPVRADDIALDLITRHASGSREVASLESAVGHLSKESRGSEIVAPLPDDGKNLASILPLQQAEHSGVPWFPERVDLTLYLEQNETSKFGGRRVRIAHTPDQIRDPDFVARAQEGATKIARKLEVAASLRPAVGIRERSEPLAMLQARREAALAARDDSEQRAHIACRKGVVASRVESISYGVYLASRFALNNGFSDWIAPNLIGAFAANVASFCPDPRPQPDLSSATFEALRIGLGLVAATVKLVSSIGESVSTGPSSSWQEGEGSPANIARDLSLALMLFNAAGSIAGYTWAAIVERQALRQLRAIDEIDGQIRREQIARRGVRPIEHEGLRFHLYDIDSEHFTFRVDEAEAEVEAEVEVEVEAEVGEDSENSYSVEVEVPDE